MNPCNRGELLTRSVQENAANRTAAIKTRAQLCEHADRFIANRSSNGTQLCASNFLGDRTRPCPAGAGFAPRRELSPSAPRHSARDIHRLAKAPIAGRRGDRFPETTVPRRMLISRFCVWCDSRLQTNTMIGGGRFRPCACANLFGPFGVLVVWVLIRRDQIPPEMSEMTPALKNHPVLKRLSFCSNHQAIILLPCVPVGV